MPAIISLRAVADALEEQSDQNDSYLNPATGEILTVTHEEERMLEEQDEDEDDYDEASLSQWQVDALKQVREFLAQKPLHLLPDAFAIHEWQIMNDFAEEQKDDRTRNILSRALHGSGAFRSFKNSLDQFGIEEAWFRFRRKALEDIAREWLEEHHLSYE